MLDVIITKKSSLFEETEMFTSLGHDTKHTCIETWHGNPEVYTVSVSANNFFFNYNVGNRNCDAVS